MYDKSLILFKLGKEQVELEIIGYTLSNYMKRAYIHTILEDS